MTSTLEPPHHGQTIAREVRGGSAVAPRVPFVYRDKGSLAVIGKAKAVARIGRWQSGGFLAWLLWGCIHIAFLIGFRHRVQVLLSWFWNWLLNARDARLITGDAQLDIHVPIHEAGRGLDQPPMDGGTRTLSTVVAPTGFDALWNAELHGIVRAA